VRQSRDLAVDGVAVHGEVLTGGETTLTDGADEAVDMVDVLTCVHDQLVSADRRQAATAQLRHEQPAPTSTCSRGVSDSALCRPSHMLSQQL